MYQAIVFLPLLGAILAGLIALAGARARFPGEGPVAGRRPIIARTTRTMAHARRRRHAHDASRATATSRAAAGSRTAELITTTLLMVSMILSWIAFVAGRLRRITTCAMPVFTWMHGRRSQGRLVAAHRHADRGDAGGGQHRVGLRASLFDRLHARGPVPAALLRLSVAVHLRHADAGDRRQPGAAVLRLGRRGPGELSADRLLVSEAGSERRRDQGLRRQPRRRFRLRARHLRRVLC